MLNLTGMKGIFLWSRFSPILVLTQKRKDDIPIGNTYLYGQVLVRSAMHSDQYWSMMYMGELFH
jgi:hypothetical protein